MDEVSQRSRSKRRLGLTHGRPSPFPEFSLVRVRSRRCSVELDRMGADAIGVSFFFGLSDGGFIYHGDAASGRGT